MKKNIVLLAVAIFTFLSLVTFATYAYFQVGTLTVTNVANSNTVTERNNMTFITIGGGMNLNISLANMTNTSAGTVAASNSTTLKVEFTANTSYNIVCTYDIVYEWTSTDKYTAHSTNVSANEFTVQATLTSNSHVNEGINHIKNETDLNDAAYTVTSPVVVSGAQIDSTGTTKNTATWTINSKFYNVNADQSTHSGKTFAGKFRVANVSCVAGSLSAPNTLARYLINTATKSGTSPVGSSPWKLMLDRPGYWVYVGKNPNNYITFNGELWRIVGVINRTYCTGTFTDTTCSATATGDLVKIVRNQSEGAMAWDTNGTNKWQASSLKTTLQSKTYASNSHVAVVKWGLYGTTTAAKAPYQFYQIEYLNSGGATASGNPTSWYGKVGVIHMSDFGNATLGNNAATGTYSRTNCINRSIASWTSSYKTYCSLNSWLGFDNVTSTAPSAGVAWWSMGQVSGAATNVFYVTAAGISASGAATTATINVRPAVYLKPETLVSGTHTGAYNDPYVIS